MKHLLYLPIWFLKARFLGKKKPLQSVLFISDKCNLTCRHCTIYEKEHPVTKSYEQIKQELIYCYEQGSRFVDFEGGEPFLWREGERDLNSLIDLAKEIGFFSATVTTNAQLPFENCRADSIWVSLDGLGGYHDSIRGEGSFQRLEKNVASCGHQQLSANMVINSLNYTSVVDTIEYVHNSPYFKSIALNFHTPFPGTEELFIDWETRGMIIDKIINLKKKGRHIMNSVSGLKLMKSMNFPTQCWVTNFIMVDGSRLEQCNGHSAGVCDRCGFCMAGEMRSVFTFKPDTIMAGMNLRVKSK